MRRTAMRRMTMILATLLMASGCGSDPVSPLDPFEPEINGARDNFQLQATDVTGVETILEYSWENTGPEAVVDHSTTTVAGAAAISIRDADGAQVYAHRLEPSLNEDTGIGAAGTWTITVVLTDYSGTLNFRVQKKT